MAVSHQSLPPQPEGSKQRDVVVYVLNQTDLDRINDPSDRRYARAIDDFIQQTNLKGLNVEQIRKKSKKNRRLPVYSMRAGSKERIFFTNCPTKTGTALLILCVDPTHDYKLSILDNTELLASFLDHIKAQELNTAPQDSASERTARPATTRFKKVNFANSNIIEFRSEQNMAIESHARINFICGEAGAGKTTICPGIFIAAIKNAQANGMQRISMVYLGNTHLNETFRKQFVLQCRLNLIPDVFRQAVRAQTYEEFILEKLRNKHPERQFKLVGKNECIKWLEDRKRVYMILNERRSATSSLGPNVYTDLDTLYKLFQTYSGYTEEECIRFSKRASTITGEAEIKEVYKLLQLYNRMLSAPTSNQPQPIDISLYIPDDDTFAQEEYVVFADEAHTLMPAQIVTILKTLRPDGQYYCAGDPHQNVNHVPYVDNFAGLMRGKPYARIVLGASFRCPIAVRKISKAISELANIINGGRADTLLDDTTSEEKLNNDQGIVEWHNQDTFDQAKITAIKAKITANIAAVMIIIPDPSLREIAYKIFGTPYIGTPEELMGMEADTVVLFDILNESQFEEANKIFAERQAQGKAVYNPNKPKIKSELSNNVCINRLLIGATRARRELYIFANINRKNEALCHYLEHAANAANVTPETENSINKNTAPVVAVSSTQSVENQLERLIRDLIEHDQRGNKDLVFLFKDEIKKRLTSESDETLNSLKLKINDRNISEIIDNELQKRQAVALPVNKVEISGPAKVASGNDSKKGIIPKNATGTVGSRNKTVSPGGLTTVGNPHESLRPSIDYLNKPKDLKNSTEDQCLRYYAELCGLAKMISDRSASLDTKIPPVIRSMTIELCMQERALNYRFANKNTAAIQFDAMTLSHLLHLNASFDGIKSGLVSAEITKGIIEYVNSPTKNTGISYESLKQLMFLGDENTFDSSVIYELLAKFPCERFAIDRQNNQQHDFHSVDNICRLLLNFMSREPDFLSSSSSPGKPKLTPEILAKKITNPNYSQATSLIAQIVCASLYQSNCFDLFLLITNRPDIFNKEVFIALFTTNCPKRNIFEQVAEFIKYTVDANSLPGPKLLFKVIEQQLDLLLSPDVIDAIFFPPSASADVHHPSRMLLASAAKTIPSAEFIEACFSHFTDMHKRALFNILLDDSENSGNSLLNSLISTKAGSSIFLELIEFINKNDQKDIKRFFDTVASRYVSRNKLIFNDLFKLAFRPEGFSIEQSALYIIRLMTIDSPTFDINTYTEFLSYKVGNPSYLSTPLDHLLLFGHEYLYQLLQKFPELTAKIDILLLTKPDDYVESVSVRRSVIGLTTTVTGIKCLRLLFSSSNKFQAMHKSYCLVNECEQIDFLSIDDGQFVQIVMKIFESNKLRTSGQATAVSDQPVNFALSLLNTKQVSDTSQVNDTIDAPDEYVTFQAKHVLDQFQRTDRSQAYLSLTSFRNKHEILSTMVEYNGKTKPLIYHLLAGSGSDNVIQNYVSYCMRSHQSYEYDLALLREADMFLHHHFDPNQGLLVMCMNFHIDAARDAKCTLMQMIKIAFLIIAKQMKKIALTKSTPNSGGDLFSALAGKAVTTQLNLRNTSSVTMLNILAKYNEFDFLSRFLDHARHHANLDELLTRHVQFPYVTADTDPQSSIFEDAIFSTKESSFEPSMRIINACRSRFNDRNFIYKFFNDDSETHTTSMFNRLIQSGIGIKKLARVFEYYPQLANEIPRKFLLETDSNGKTRINTKYIAKMLNHPDNLSILVLLMSREDVRNHVSQYNLTVPANNAADAISAAIRIESSSHLPTTFAGNPFTSFGPKLGTRQQRRQDAKNAAKKPPSKK